MAKNGQWRLRTRPEGMVSEANFEFVEEPVPEPAEGQVLVRNLYLSFDPAMRGWMEDVKSYVPPVQIGEVMRASAVGQVLRSRHADFAEGDLVTGLFGWQEFALCDPQRGGALGAPAKLPPGAAPELALSVLGATGLTAYFGMLEIGELRQGDAVLVSGAAGATGSVAAQIARLRGASKVVGIAGGSRKCAWLRDEAGLDAAIDYRAGSVPRRLREEFPQGVDLFFDNVGGEILDAALLNMAERGRVVLCGAISQYNAEKLPPGPRNYMQIVIRRLTLRGFIVIDHMKRAPQAVAELARWVAEGGIAHAEDIQQGIENVPATFLRLFDGSNLGKQLLKLADAQPSPASAGA